MTVSNSTHINDLRFELNTDVGYQCSGSTAPHYKEETPFPNDCKVKKQTNKQKTEIELESVQYIVTATLNYYHHDMYLHFLFQFS